MTVLQGSLISTATDTALGPLAGEVARTTLSEGAWFDLRREWVNGSDALFARLERAVPWRTEDRWMFDRIVAVPRLIAHYSEYDRLPDPILEAARSALTEFYRSEAGGVFVTASLCLYRDGHDSVAWHGDRIGTGATEDVLVAILSLGTARRFLLRPRSGGSSVRIDLGRGDLFVMGGSCQRTWDHSVPKSPRSEGARISVQFRPRNTR